MWNQETFAYADSFDQAAGRYIGLKTGQQVAVSSGSTGLIVKSEIAMGQLEKERPLESGPTATNITFEG